MPYQEPEPGEETFEDFIHDFSPEEEQEESYRRKPKKAKLQFWSRRTYSSDAVSIEEKRKALDGLIKKYPKKGFLKDIQKSYDSAETAHRRKKSKPTKKLGKRKYTRSYEEEQALAYANAVQRGDLDTANKISGKENQEYGMYQRRKPTKAKLQLWSTRTPKKRRIRRIKW